MRNRGLNLGLFDGIEKTMQGGGRDVIQSLLNENVMHLRFNPTNKQNLILVPKETTEKLRWKSYATSFLKAANILYEKHR